jgi:hypothetical protein
MRAALILLLPLVACSAKRNPSSAYAEEPAYWDDAAGYELDAETELAYVEKSKRDAPAPSRPAAPSPPAPPGLAAPEPTPEPSEPVEQAPAQRMIHYDGWARLRATDPTGTLDAIAALATEAGGRVDLLSGRQITVRVPVESFEAIYDRVLELGDVIDKSVRADDVTDQFLAVDLRVRTLRMTRDRLVALLAKAESEEEKLALLQQITRVTEELDATESQLRTLADLAAMSRISVEVVPREAFGTSAQGPELAGMEWIRGLSPFRRAVFEDDKRLGLEVPKGLVSLAMRGPFVAESPEGAVLWTLRVPNDPMGDADFWIATVEDRIASEFADPERRELGRWDCLALDEPGSDEPYRWQICVAPEGRHLHVAQVYYPGPESLERYGEAVDRVLRVGGDS